MPRDTSGLKKFAKARDAVLKKRGFSTYARFTDAIRKEYALLKVKDFAGWNKARDTVLIKAGVRGGYKGLMLESKAEFAKLK